MSIDKENDFSDDQEDFDPKKHKQLLQSISRLGKNQYIQKPSRSEPVLKQDEFHLSKSGKISQVKVKDTAVSVNDLVKILNKTNHLDVGKELKTTQWSKKVLPKPLEKPVADRLQRKIGYEKTKFKLRKWDPVVAKNRQSDHQVFPLDYEEIHVDTTSYSKKPKPVSTSIKSELQIEMEALEDKLKELKGIKKDDVDENDKEKKILEKLTRKELISKRKELAYMRMKQSQKSAKDRLHNKIKSKKYHKLLKKEKLKEQLKQFEILQKTNPEAAMEQLEQIEKSRVLERANLRHKNTGTWAKNLQVRAKYDKDVRKDLAEQLAISRELTQKRDQNSDDDDNDKESDAEINGGNDDEQDEEVDPFNPWVKVSKKKEKNPMDEVLTGYKKYWLERNENEKIMQEYKKIIEESNLDNGTAILSDEENKQEDISKFKKILQSQQENGNDKETRKNESDNLEIDSESLDLSFSDDDDSKEEISKDKEVLKTQKNINLKGAKLNKKGKTKSLKTLNKAETCQRLKTVSSISSKKTASKIIENGWIVEEISNENFPKENNTNLKDGVKKNSTKLKTSKKDVDGSNKKRKLISKDIDDIFDAAEENVHQKLSKKIKNMKNALQGIENNNKFQNNKRNKIEKNELQNLKDLTFKNEKQRPEFDEELNETPVNGKVQDNSKNLLSDLPKESNISKEKKGIDTDDQIDPNNFANIKPKRLHTLINTGNADSSLFNDEVGDENQIDLDLSRQMTIAEAFEDDDVVADFTKEKDDKNKQNTEIDLTMPGWGSWAGCGIKPKTKKRLVLKFPEKEKRRDDNKGNLYINENTSKELKEHLVSDLPFPFTSVKDYEGSIRAPIGRSFVPESAFRVLTRPAVQTKMGHIIEPMNESILVKKPFVRKHKVDFQVEKMLKKEKANKMKKKQ